MSDGGLCEFRIFRWDRQAEAVPVCIDYTIVENHDATNGEFWLNALGRATERRNGQSLGWLEAYLSVPRAANAGTVLAAGLWARCQTGATQFECLSLGAEIETDYWLTGLPTFRATASPGSQHIENTQILEFSFFLDVRRPGGEHVRLWQSQRGANYSLEDAFGRPGFLKSSENGTIEYADEGGVLFEEKRKRSAG